jgi:hypothetical protein
VQNQREGDVRTVYHETIPPPPRCKITLKQMSKGEYAHEDPATDLEVVNAQHASLVATYGGQDAE